MPSSKLVRSAQESLYKIESLLSEERMLAEVDQPLDQAIQAFRLELEEPLSRFSFNRAVGEFVRHVYQTGLRLPRQLSETKIAPSADTRGTGKIRKSADA